MKNLKKKRRTENGREKHAKTEATTPWMNDFVERVIKWFNEREKANKKLIVCGYKMLRTQR